MVANTDYKSSLALDAYPELQEDGARASVSLKGRSSSRTTSTGSGGSSVRVRGNNKKGWGFSEALFGIVLIWTAIPMIWMNERKDVKMYKVITKGRRAVVEADCQEPTEEFMMKLVHVMGETTTE